MRAMLLEGPAEEPIDVGLVREQGRITETESGNLIELYIRASRERIERELGRALMPQRWRWTADCWPDDGRIVLAMPPLIEVQAVEYRAASGVWTEVASDRWEVDASGINAVVMPVYGQSWPVHIAQPASVRVTYRCGYASADAVPDAIRHYLLVMATTSYEVRESFITGQVVELPQLRGLVDAYRVAMLGSW